MGLNLKAFDELGNEVRILTRPELVQAIREATETDKTPLDKLFRISYLLRYNFIISDYEELPGLYAADEPMPDGTTEPLGYYTAKNGEVREMKPRKKRSKPVAPTS